MTNKRKLLIGLTGGIASGKTAVADRLAALGAVVVDTDQIAREVVEPGTAGLQTVIQRFGDSILDADGCLDRRRLRELVFSDATARSDLNAILHPRIRRLAMQRIEEGTAPYAVLVVPLLVEGSLADAVDRILVVDVPETLQLARVMERDQVTREQARAVVEAQASREQRLARADDILRNEGTLDELRRQVDELHQRYLHLAGSR